jgi:hypothetical protein
MALERAIDRSMPAPTIQDPTLSRAFELVIKEMESSLDSLKDSGDDDPELQNCIKREAEIVATLRDYHPARMGLSASGRGFSLYERSLERARADLSIIDLELQRLQKRKTALEAIVLALAANVDAESETR